MDVLHTLVELDIMNDRRDTNGPLGLEDDDGREWMKRATRIGKTWIGGRVPYAFDPFMSK